MTHVRILAWLAVIALLPACLWSLPLVPVWAWLLPMGIILLVGYRLRPEQVEEDEDIPDVCLARGDDPHLRQRWKVAFSRWRAAMDALPDGVLLLDYRFAVCWFNPEARQMLELCPDRHLGRPLALHMEDPLLDDYLRREDFTHPIQLASPVNGNLVLEFKFLALTGDEGWLVLIRDISGPYQLEQRQTDFMDNISHELKTPLTVFRGVLELLPEMRPDSPQWENALGLLHKQSLRMQALIEDQTRLLRLGSKRYGFPFERLAMEPFLREMIDAAVVLSGERGHRFVAEIDESFPFEANRELLRCVASNLLTNSVRHTPAGSEVGVTWELDDQRRPVLTVADNGPGIACHHLPRLTERFYRVNAHQKVTQPDVKDDHGSGLGLALVKQAMARANGKLEIVSHLGSGSRFICRFPPLEDAWG
ncbi:MAG: PAS domain-containing protein [Magnetococcales bacterium]|nr:PAS domain-containing protein [Magnetococcales bacterium]